MYVLKDAASLMEDIDMHIFVGHFLDGLFDSITEFQPWKVGLGGPHVDALRRRIDSCLTHVVHLRHSITHLRASIGEAFFFDG